MTTSINGLWKLPELWKPAGTAGPGSHKFFAKRPTVERFAQAPTGHHQRLVDLGDPEGAHWRNRVRRCDNRSAGRHPPAPTTVNWAAAPFLLVLLSSEPTRVSAETINESMLTTAAVLHK